MRRVRVNTLVRVRLGLVYTSNYSSLSIIVKYNGMDGRDWGWSPVGR